MQTLLAFPFVLLFILYILAAYLSNRFYKPWPISRTIYWTLGILLGIISVAGPLANHAHLNFTTHMICHLLLGMLAPLLMALAAPMTLWQRTLRVPLARRLSKILRSWPLCVYTHPIFATLLNVGGLWVLYETDLYSIMHQNMLVHFIVHVHLFFAGYLFTISMIYIKPVSQRFSFLYRSILLIIAFAAHGILAKVIYAHPPAGIPTEQAEQAAIIMYYGGDAIDLVIVFILCYHWFKATRPRIELVI